MTDEGKEVGNEYIESSDAESNSEIEVIMHQRRRTKTKRVMVKR